jgi:hypothetical protein
MPTTNDQEEVCGLHGVACPDGPLFKCQAKGTTEDGKTWRCGEKPVAKGYCDGHRMQVSRGRPLTPLNERRDEPGSTMTIFVSDSDRDLLGAAPSSKASAIVRAWAERERRRRDRVLKKPRR